MSVTFVIRTATGTVSFGSPDLNVSNSNALRVLELLGLEQREEGEDPILAGECGVTDFLGRVLIALALTPYDEGTPEWATTNPAGSVWVDCGRRAGYLAERLTELANLAAFARAEEADCITWG
jgi:hypothetical protein